jgi:long-chain acyl-CoA synthetase
MPRQSLLEYFQPDSRPTNEPAVVWRRGYRTIRWTYGDLWGAATQFAAELSRQGIAKGDRVLLWGPNTGEWVAAFLGCLFCGAAAVPMDAIADEGFARRVVEQAGVKLAVVGEELIGQGKAKSIGAATIRLEDLGAGKPQANWNGGVQPSSDDPVEIVFTSGTTAEPRGVVLSHGNILANLAPIEKEIKHYRRYERIFHPLRFLDLLPLSHVFGQLLGVFIAQILGATSVFLDTLNPAEVIRTIHDERVSVVITVPRLIESLRDHVERDLAARGQLEKLEHDLKASEGEHFLRRWWRVRAIRRRFGWKFWAIVSGGAALPAASEQFWSRLGYAVIQGYGLTETTSLVTLNHPFRLGKGSIGKALPGLEMKLGDDGEILVRGQNVAAGYWQHAGVAPLVDADGWFHTGDLGERDEAGNVYFKGRRKNVIVTPEGLKVYPQDLEAELRKEAEVKDCVVVGLERDGNAEPCAVLLLRDSTDGTVAQDTDTVAAAVVQRANERLAPFQRMRRWMVWPGKDFPRTPTQKPLLAQIREAAEEKFGAAAEARATGGNGGAAQAPATASPIGEILSRISRGRTLAGGDAAKLDLSSIERVELMSALEDRYQVDLSEKEFTDADTVSAVARLVDQVPEKRAARAASFHYPRWPQSWAAQILRAAIFNVLARPAMALLGWPRVRGRENVTGVKGPLLVVSNHVAFFDPAYVLEALPAKVRYKLAVAMDGELLESYRNPPRGTGFFTGLAHRAAYWLLLSVYNVFPLPRLAGFRESFAFVGDLVDRGWSVLIFPEGVLTKDGRVGPFRSGIGLLAKRLGVPIVPVRLDGIFELKQAGKHWARPGQIKASIGAPVQVSKDEVAEEIARDLQGRVVAL